MPGKIVIIGSGISGLATATFLSPRFTEQVLVLEREPHLGGLTATIRGKDFCYDLGSHRIHPHFHPGALRFIARMLDGEMLRRSRRGKVYFNNRLLNYPPNLGNLIATLPLVLVFFAGQRYIVGGISLTGLKG